MTEPEVCYAAAVEGAWSWGGRGSAKLRGGEGAARGAEGAGEIRFEGGLRLERGVMAVNIAVFHLPFRAGQFLFQLRVGQLQAGEVVSGRRGL